MSISPPPFSPPRLDSNEEDDNDYVNIDDEEYIDSARTLISSFDLYKNAIDRLRTSITCSSIDEQKSALEHFKPLSTRTNAWLYMRIHDDLFNILLEYLIIDNLSIQSTVLSIFANIACEQASHEQILETDLINIVCQKVIDISQIDITNRCFRLLGNVCTVEDAARRMIDADLTRSMGNVLRTCTDPACLHSIIRCSRKLSTYAFCRDRMLDSMCLLSICKQLFSEKVALRKEAMKAVLEWDIENSDRSRSQLREGEIFRFLITTIEGKTEKEYRHIAFRLLNNLLRHSDMRTEFGLRNGLDFLLKMLNNHQYQSIYEHLKFLGLFCVCCQESTNRRLIKDDIDKLKLFFNYLEKYQYRSNFLDLLLTAIGQFIYNEQSLMIFIKQMQFIERMSDLLESVVIVKYDINEQDQRKRKKFKTKHATNSLEQSRIPVTIEFNEVLFTEFVENTHLDDERQISNTSANTNIEIRRRTEALIFTLLSKLSYETTDKTLRKYLYNSRLISLILRYIAICDEPNPRAIRIIYRLTKMTDCIDYLFSLGLPYLIWKNFYSNEIFSIEINDKHINSDDQYLLNILLNENRAFFQRLSWTNERNRLKIIEYTLEKNIEYSLNTPYGINEIRRQLNDINTEEKYQLILTIIPIMKEYHLKSILFDQNSGYDYLIDQANERTCFWALHTLVNRCSSSNDNSINEFLVQLQIHSQSPLITETRYIDLNINNEKHLTVNIHLLSSHSDYFKTLFNGSFIERNQSIIPIHLSSTIPTDSFIYLYHILTNPQDILDINQMNDLFHLCDEFLFDYLPYRLVQFILEQFQNNIYIELIDIISKSNLIPSLIRGYFSHLFMKTTNYSLDIFGKLMRKYPEELRTLILCFLNHRSWFKDEYSPFFDLKEINSCHSVQR